MFNSEFWDVWMRYFNQLIAPAILVTLRLVAVTMLICVGCRFWFGVSYGSDPSQQRAAS